MKKIIFLLLIASTCSVASVRAQNVKPDSLEAFLCKTWEMKYAMAGSMKVDPIKSAAILNCEFKKDKTYILTSEKTVKATGTWSYDPAKKAVIIVVNGRKKGEISDLKNNEFTIVFNVDQNTPSAMQMKMIYGVKEN